MLLAAASAAAQNVAATIAGHRSGPPPAAMAAHNLRTLPVGLYNEVARIDSNLKPGQRRHHCSAEFGRQSGGVVNAVAKSGTTSKRQVYHGKDRSSFFPYQGTLLRVVPAEVQRIVLTTAQRRGDFSALNRALRDLPPTWPFPAMRSRSPASVRRRPILSTTPCPTAARPDASPPSCPLPATTIRSLRPTA